MLTFSPVPKTASGLGLAAPPHILASLENWGWGGEEEAGRGPCCGAPLLGPPCGNALQTTGSVNAELKVRREMETQISKMFLLPFAAISTEIR